MAYADRPSQVELTRPNGTTLIADVALTRLPDHPNAAFVALLHDVTDMKKREGELRAARDQAEAASNSKSQFLANMHPTPRRTAISTAAPAVRRRLRRREMAASTALGVTSSSKP